MFRKSVLFLSIFVLFFTEHSNTQTVLSGVVSDSDSDPVQNALVQLIDQVDTTIVFQDITNENGEYFIQVTSVNGQQSRQPDSYKLFQNYPNPFNPSTVIFYELAKPTNVKIVIHNILGQKIKTLVDGFQSNLYGKVIWDATDDKGNGVSAGVYIYSLIADGHRINKKMLLLDGYQGRSRSGNIPSQINYFSTAENTNKTVSNSFLLKVSGDQIQTYREYLQLTDNMELDITVLRTINKNAVFIDTTKTKINIISVDTTSYSKPIYNIQFEGEIPELKAGSVIVDSSGLGKIYVVIEDGKLEKRADVISVIQGSLDFLLQNTELQVATPQNRTKQQTTAIENKLPLVSNELYGKINEEEIYIPFDDTTLVLEIPFDNETIWEDPSGDFSITIPEGSLYFKTAVDFQTIYSNRDLVLSLISPVLSIGAFEYLKLVTYSDMDLNLKVHFHAEDSYEISEEKVELASYFHTIPIGYVILTLKITLNLNFNINVDASMDITTGYEVKNNFVLGLEVPDGPLSEPNYYEEFIKIEESILSPQLEADLTFIERLEIVPDVELYLYGIVGANGELIPYQEFILNAYAFNDLVDWDCEFAIGLDGRVSLDLSAFHFDEATIEIVSKYLTGPRYPLYSAPHLELLSGNNQVGTAGERLSDPFRVIATDNFGNLCLLPVNVYWDVTQGGGQLDALNSYYTYADGYAENYYVLGNSEGENRVTSYLKKADGSIHNENIFISTAEESGSDGLVAYYPFNGDATDESGNNNNGTIIGGVTPAEDRFGSPYGSMQFNGIDGYIEVPNSISLQSPSSEITIAAWIYLDGFPSGQVEVAGIVNKTKTQEYGQYNFNYQAWSTPVLAYSQNAGIQGYVSQINPLLFSTWYFVAITNDGNTITLYLNDSIVGTSPVSGQINPDSNSLTIGLDTPGETEYLHGRLDDIRIYNRNLTFDEIMTLYHESGWATGQETGTVTDIDGNVYKTIKIGNQWWMAENLKVTRYRNGDPISNVTDVADWTNLSSGAYCNYDNDVNNVGTYGSFYNWYAVDDARGLAPEGWRVPTDDDWKELEMYLGMSQAELDLFDAWRGTNEGGKLKETGTTHWLSPNTGATNESGFTALPGGQRNGWGIFTELGHTCVFHTSTLDGNDSYRRYLDNTHSSINRYSTWKICGYSIRCLKN